MTVLRSGSASDVGRVRAVNEDLALESLNLFAVADGMGGHAGGEVASHTAIEALEHEFSRQPTAQGLVSAVRRANRSVWDRSHEDPDLRGMGTTLTAAALVGTDDGDRLILANVGDSRTYRFHQGRLSQLSRDHSVAEELVDRGELSEEEAAIHPHRHILTRALGVAPEVEVDVWQARPEAGDRYLLCSDGLTNEVSEDRITNVLASTADPQQAAATLVRMANEHGGNDNVTVVVLDVLVGEDAAGSVDGDVVPVAVDSTGRLSNGDNSDGTARPRTARGGSSRSRSASTAGAAGAGGGTGARAAGADSDGESDDDITSAVPVADEPRMVSVSSGSLLSRVAGDPVAGMRTLGSRSAEVSSRFASRRVTLRVLAFVIVLGALFVGGYSVVHWYVDSSYFVQLRSGQVEIFQGRMGGFLGIDPKVVEHTGIPADKVPAAELAHVTAGVEESSLAAARNYVRNLRQEEASLLPPPPTTTTAPSPAPGG